MKITIILFSLILISASSCETLNLVELRDLKKVKFYPMELSPEMETNNLRIDLERHKYTERVNDSTETTKDTPYNPIGFNLGNGLFYDLNRNLCLRLDFLLSFSPERNFEVAKVNKPEKSKGIVIYKFKNDSLSIALPPGHKPRYDHHLIRYSDSIVYMDKNRMRYAIAENDTSMTYSGKHRKWDVIHKTGQDKYHVNNPRWNKNYQIIGNDVFLENYYKVSLADDSLSIKIKIQGRKKDRVLYSIERSDDRIFIFNNGHYGMKLERKGNSILVYRGQTLFCKYELR